jgi:hypothetical protein
MLGMFNDKEFSRLRALAHSVVASANARDESQCQISAKRYPEQIEMTVSYRPGTAPPSDALGYLGDLVDAIRSELRLEQTAWGTPLYKTSESTFEIGLRPEFQFAISKTGAGDEDAG